MRPVVHASMFLKASPNDILVVFGGDGGLVVVLFVVACCFETESLFVALAGLELRDLPTFTSRVLGSKICITTLGPRFFLLWVISTLVEFYLLKDLKLYHYCCVCL